MSWLTIAMHTFLQERRGKLFFNIIAFAILLFVSSFMFTEVSIGNKAKIFQDIGLAGISILSVLTAILTGCNVVSGDIQNHTIYTIMTKPIRRWEIIVGKTAGLWILIFVNEAIMAFCFYLIGKIYGYPVPLGFLWAYLFIFFEAVVMESVAILFSLFVQGYLAMVFTFAVYIIGHTVSDLRLFCEASGSKLGIFFSNIIFFIFPNLKAFDIKNQIVHGIKIMPGFFAAGISYMFGYVALIIIISCFIFNRKEI